jgi:hypothetical protein
MQLINNKAEVIDMVIKRSYRDFCVCLSSSGELTLKPTMESTNRMISLELIQAGADTAPNP